MREASWTVDATRQWIRARLRDGAMPVSTLIEEVEPFLPATADAGDVIEVILDDLDGVIRVVSGDIDALDIGDGDEDGDGDDDVVVLRDGCLDGVVFLHRVRPAGPATGGEDPDTIAIDMSTDALIPLNVDHLTHVSGAPEGVEIRRRSGVNELVGPRRWVESLTDGWLGFTQDGAGGWQLLTWAPDDPPMIDEELTTVLREWCRGLEPKELVDGIELMEALLSHVHGRPSLPLSGRRRVIAPLSDVLAGAGCSAHDGFVGGPGIDWAAIDKAGEIGAAAGEWGISAEAATAVMLLQGGARVWESFQDLEPETDLGAMLDEDDRRAFLDSIRLADVAETVVAEHLQPLTFAHLAPQPDAGTIAEDAAILAASWAGMLEAQRPFANDRERSRIDWMRSRLPAPRIARLELLESAHRADPRNVAVLDDRVWFAAVRAHDISGRGRLDDALQHWVAADATPDMKSGATPPTVQQILRIATSVVGRSPVRRSGPVVGRNDKCPCGSGRKYKVCHLGKSLDAPADGPALTSVAVRPLVPWVQALGLLWYDRLDAARVRELRTGLRALPPGDVANVMMTFVLDAEVFTEGVVEQFIAEATEDGAAFPPALVELMLRWAAEPFRLCEVTDRVVGATLMLRDLRTGDQLVVEGPDTSRHHEVGSLLLGRIIPNGESLQFAFGTLPVPWLDRDAVLELLDVVEGHLDADMIVDMIVGRTGRAGMARDPGRAVQNTDGDPLLFHRTVLRPVDGMVSAQMIVERIVHPDLDPDELDELDDDDEAGDGGAVAARWHLVVADDVNRTLRATITVRADDATIVVETNSQRRRDRAVELVRGLVGGVEVVSEWADDLDDVRLAGDLGLSAPPLPGGAAGPMASMEPEQLAEIRAEMGRRWLKGPVPALGGLTPEEAADDPTRRRDLIELLRSYRQGPGDRSPLGREVVPDPNELAALLGIDLPR